jgi:hypothetical protein
MARWTDIFETIKAPAAFGYPRRNFIDLEWLADLASTPDARFFDVEPKPHPAEAATDTPKLRPHFGSADGVRHAR